MDKLTVELLLSIRGEKCVHGHQTFGQRPKTNSGKGLMFAGAALKLPLTSLVK